MMEPTQERDKQLWKIAKERASFKKHAGSYFITNAFFWALWFFTDMGEEHDGWPWPVWPMLGWGIGLAFHYFEAYHADRISSTEKEYEKLKREREGK
jgi:hypothetical protein